MPSLCHIWWIFGGAESFAPVLQWAGLGVRRKGLPQASAAVWWSVTGRFSQPSGTKTSLWSVSISDRPGWKTSAQHIFIYILNIDQIRNVSFQSLGRLCCLAPCFMSSSIAINICCYPGWLGEDVYWTINACFLQYCSNILLSHGGTKTDTDRH